MNRHTALLGVLVSFISDFIGLSFQRKTNLSGGTVATGDTYSERLHGADQFPKTASCTVQRRRQNTAVTAAAIAAAVTRTDAAGWKHLAAPHRTQNTPPPQAKSDTPGNTGRGCWLFLTRQQQQHSSELLIYFYGAP